MTTFAILDTQIAATLYFKNAFVTPTFILFCFIIAVKSHNSNFYKIQQSNA